MQECVRFRGEAGKNNTVTITAASGDIQHSYSVNMGGMVVCLVEKECWGILFTESFSAIEETGRAGADRSSKVEFVQWQHFGRMK